MYHIPKDKRALHSAQSLYTGLLTQLKKKAYEDITVMDIIHSSGVARATFYRLFDNISDIIEWKCDEIMVTTIAELKKAERKELKETFMLFFSEWKSTTELLVQLDKNNRIDILWKQHEKHIDEIGTILFADIAITGIKRECLQGILAGMIPVIFRIWVRHPDTSVDDMFENLKQTFHLICDRLIA